MKTKKANVFKGLEHCELLGNVWEALCGSTEATLQLVPRVLQDGELLPALDARLDCGDVRCIRHENVCALLARPQGEENFFFATGFPLLPGIPRRVRIEGIHPWESGVEATVAATLLDCDGPMLTFFATDYFFNRDAYSIGKECLINFSALALKYGKVDCENVRITEGPFYESELERFLEDHPGRTREDFKGPLIDVKSSRILLPTKFSTEFEFQAPIEAVEEMIIGGTSAYRLQLPLIGVDDGALRINIFVPARMTKSPPKVGDAVGGGFWLEGSMFEF